ncbi:MAG: HypC/HybG/HupF family hydrogenase formation chaperone [Tetrasphaera sp.]|nr:HypC/HybG/HupF family hydrogenase formation chaperone [Tetrasphaera sp.]
MCLGVPGRITRTWSEDDGRLLADADFAGETRTIRLNYLPDLTVGDFTIVHAGYALTRLTPEDAAETIRTMREVGLLPTPQPAGAEDET